MDFSKLSQNDRWAVYGAAATFIGGVVSNWQGLVWLAVVAALGAAVIVFLPQLSAGTSLPGSKGTLLATLGIAALGANVIEALRFLNYFFNTIGNVQTLAFVVAIVGSALMAWAGWTELRTEGGRWRFGSSPSPAAAPAGGPAPEADAPVAEQPAENAPG